MLMELMCDQFKQIINGKTVPRGKIIFHEGLNTIVGDKQAGNSIGKSTFLLIIDFCFGGDFYAKNCKVTHFIGNHAINFAFKFEDTIEYYSRNTLDPNIIRICDSNYIETGAQLSLTEFTQHLLEKYQIQAAENSFRGVVGQYARIYGRENYNEKEPLKYGNRSVSESITEFEKLFGVYNLIKESKEAYEKKKKLKSVRKDAMDLGEIAPVAKNRTQVKNNQKEIEKLQHELEEIIRHQDEALSQSNTENLDRAVTIKGQITVLKRNRSRLISQRTTIQNNLEGGKAPTDGDLSKLKEFFPGANFPKLECIEVYHQELTKILSAEMSHEITELDTRISNLTTRIHELEKIQRSLGIPTSIPQKFLEQVVTLERKISILQDQNTGYQREKDIKDSVKSLKTQLETVRENQLSIVQTIINQEMVRLNDMIYNGTRHAPEIRFSNARSGKPTYTFGCDWNTGTGENYKNLIIFDLSVLKTTELPILIHDSLLFKNIGDLPIDKIMELYSKSSKQIFISFDKQESFSPFTAKTLVDTQVLELHDNGGELFGVSWAKK